MLGGAKKKIGERGLGGVPVVFVLMPPIRPLPIILYVNNMTIR